MESYQQRKRVLEEIYGQQTMLNLFYDEFLQNNKN